MHWKLFATFAEAAGATDVRVEDGSPATVGEALEALLAAYPALADEVYDDEGALYEHVHLVHEGRDPFTAAQGLDTPVEAGDELALFPPVSGG